MDALDIALKSMKNTNKSLKEIKEQLLKTNKKLKEECEAQIITQ